MSALNDLSSAQVLAGILSVLTILLGGLAVKQRASKVRRDGAENDAEGSLFKSALMTMAQDRDRWRKSAEEAWAENGALRAETVGLRKDVSQLKMNIRLLGKYPNLAREFTSGPAALDSRPLPPVTPSVEDG